MKISCPPLHNIHELSKVCWDSNVDVPSILISSIYLSVLDEYLCLLVLQSVCCKSFVCLSEPVMKEEGLSLVGESIFINKLSFTACSLG